VAPMERVNVRSPPRAKGGRMDRAEGLARKRFPKGALELPLDLREHGRGRIRRLHLVRDGGRVEFLLRDVADDVSCSLNDDQGGREVAGTFTPSRAAGRAREQQSRRNAG